MENIKKIVTIVGARPQFIKAAMVSKALGKNLEEIIVHTGQHYDKNMSEIFFEQLEIPKPKYNLGVGSGSHGKQTGEMLIKIEEVLIKENPDFVMVYGDTNSTLAGALAASKLLIPVIHVESGLRSFNRKMPEEQNRVLTDHISSILFCSTQTSVDNLKNEGITKNVFLVGDVMCDSVLHYSKIAEQRINTTNINLIPLYEKRQVKDWYLTTIHRAENTFNNINLSNILEVFDKLDKTVIFPVHPRIKQMINELYEKNKYKNVYFVEPVDYLTMLYLTKNACKVVTDSGGLQKECYILDTPCITIRDQTEWVETLANGYNVLAKPEVNDLYNKILNSRIDKDKKKINYYGNGNAAIIINDIIKDYTHNID